MTDGFFTKNGFGGGATVGMETCLHLTSQLTSHIDLLLSSKNENFELSPFTNFGNPFTSRKLIFFATLPSASASAMILFSVIESS